MRWVDLFPGDVFQGWQTRGGRFGIACRAIHASLGCRHDCDRPFPSEGDLEDEIAFLHEEKVFVPDLKPGAWRFVQDPAPETIDADLLVELVRMPEPRFHRAPPGLTLARLGCLV